MNEINIRNIERQFFAKPKQASPQDLQLLAQHYWHQWQNSPETDIRIKGKLLKQAVHFAGWAVENGMSDESTLKWYLDVISESKKQKLVGESTNKIQSRILAKWLEVRGFGDANIILEKKGSVSTESGTLMISDSAFALPLEGDIENLIKQAEGDTKAIFVSTGGDGTFGIRLRYIEGDEPILKKAEYRKLETSINVCEIEVPTGVIRVSDIIATPGVPSVELQIPPGKYRVGVFMLEERSFFCYVIVCTKIS